MESAVLALVRAQIFFSIALGLVALLITFFAFYVLWSTMWGNRWYRQATPSTDDTTPEAGS